MPRFVRWLAVVAGATLALGIGGSSATARPGAVAPPRGDELERLAQPPGHTALASQRIYFVMPDRYANGDPANDRGGLSGGRSVTGYDPTDLGWYHGGWRPERSRKPLGAVRSLVGSNPTPSASRVGTGRFAAVSGRTIASVTLDTPTDLPNF